MFLAWFIVQQGSLIIPNDLELDQNYLVGFENLGIQHGGLKTINKSSKCGRNHRKACILFGVAWLGLA
jgi:hypothetical protein